MVLTRGRGMHVPVADLPVINAAAAADDWGLLKKTWIGEVSDVAHRLAVALPSGTGVGKVDWFLCLHWFPKSSALLWPCDLIEVPGTPFRWLQMRQDVRMPALRPIADLRTAKASSIAWKSWAWQLHELKKRTQDLSPAIRPCLEGHFGDSLAQVARRAAWWSMPKTSIESFAAELGIDLPCKSSLFEVLWHTIKGLLKTPDEETLAIVHKRLSSQYDDMELTDALLQIDEAVEVMDKHDHDKVQEAKHQAENKLVQRKEFQCSFDKKAHSLFDKKDSKSFAKLPKKVLPHHLDQKVAAKFMPPGASLWRDKKRGGWCSHLPPNKRISESFTKHGDSDLALRALLKRSWTQYARGRGRAPGKLCPIVGLFDD